MEKIGCLTSSKSNKNKALHEQAIVNFYGKLETPTISEGLSKTAIITIAIVTVNIVLLFTSTILFRRRKIYQYADWILLDSKIAFINPTELFPFLKDFELPRECLTIENEIGCGEFGVVFKATISKKNEKSETAVALKHSLKDINSLTSIADELKIMMYLQKVKNQTHPNIIELLGCITKNAKEYEIFAITEFCHFGNMKSFIEKNRGNFINELDDLGVINNRHMANFDNPLIREQV